MEAVGLVFTILPLLKGPARKFKGLILYVGRFKNFLKGFRRLQARVLMLEIIFKFQLKMILQSALESSSPVIEVMLANVDHPAWKDPENETCIATYLTSSGKVACVDTIKQIAVDMEAIESHFEELDRILSHDFALDARGRLGEAMETLKKRALSSPKACSLEKRINKELENLAQGIDHLKQIVTEAEKCLQSSIRGPVTSQEEKAWHGEAQSFLVTQKTSRALFDALKTTCQSHQHSFHLTLNPRVDTSGPSRTDFEVALQHNNHRRQGSNDWLLICSSSTATVIGSGKLEQDVVPQNTLPLVPSLNKSRKRTCPDDTTIKRRPGISKEKDDKAVSLPLAAPLARPLRNLSREMFFFGFFDIGQDYKHLVYLTEKDLTKQSYEIQQLGNILARSTTTIPERIRLSRYLAQAALYFATNPWLRNGWWTLQDISFFVNPVHLEASEFIDKPFITTNVGASKTLQSESPSVKVLNPLLFNLAVIMIEIALGVPLRSRRIPTDEISCSNDTEIDLRTATRLTNNLGSTVGRRYRKAVEHCLNQSQETHDFDNQEAQKEYFLRVVHPLRAFEREFDI